MTSFIHKAVNKRSISNRGLVCGIGINDADYIINQVINGKIVRCAYYSAWRSMLQRCYSASLHARYPTYIGCTVCDEWLLFSNFRAWMIKQDWKGMSLDKDILLQGNKKYSPDTCLFVSVDINNLLNDSKAKRGNYKIGVYYYKKSKKFRSSCNVSGTLRHIGCFETEELAYEAYKEFKYKVIADIAKEQTEPLRSALLNYRIYSRDFTMNIDGVEADRKPERLSELERQRKKIEWLKQLREQREELKAKQGEDNE